ncbi:MAG TPA: galactitol-1-phosphate 5-dehydrogenase [Caldilineaceae bacterium]|nr:galactitol-1-phosphate 5-dehydrogenase [Caldilineaceae bacterium]
MQALVWEGPRQMNMRDVDTPQPAADEVLIRVAYSGICGSELGGYLGHNSLRVPPLIMGHEFSGEIVALGENATEIKAGLATGQQVTVNPLISPPWSKAALRGRHNLTLPRNILGIHRPGSYAEYVTAPASNVYPLPEGMSLEHAALTEPLGCGLRVARLSGCTATDTVLITGLGPIGLLTLQCVKAMGVQSIIATDTDADRIEIGKHFGVEVLNPMARNVVEAVREATGGEGADVAIDAVGATVTRRQCLDAVRPGGKVIFTGLHEEESNIQANLLIRNEINLQGSFAYTPLDFEDAFKWLAEGRIEIDPWLLKAPLAEGGACFERLLSKPGPVAKILLHL